MIRKIIRIDKEKCNGCGVCADACHEGAIDIINGKAELVREHFCDGLGDCLPECPTGAISFEEREAPEYDDKAVKEAQKNLFIRHQAGSVHTDNKTFSYPFLYSPLFSVYNFSVNTYRYNLPWYEFSTVLNRFFCCHLQAAAAWNLHSYNGHTLNVIILNNCSQLFTVIHLI